MHKPRKRVKPDERQRVFQLLKARTPVGEVSAATGVSRSEVYKLRGEYESSLPDVPREAVIQALRAYTEWALKRATEEELTPVRHKEPFGDFSYQGKIVEAFLKTNKRLGSLNEDFVRTLAGIDRSQACDTAHKLAGALRDKCNCLEVA